MNYIKQLLYDMRHQRMMMWVAISGTAVSLFLVMVGFMVNNLKTVEVAPELDRDRIYGGMHVVLKSTDPNYGWAMMSRMAYATARRLFGDLDGVELVTYCGEGAYTKNVIRKGERPMNISVKEVDGNFWKMFRFNLLAGSLFTEDDCLGNTDKVVITHSVAHRMFSSSDVVGREINLDGTIYRVSGVVEDVNPILQNSWAEVYIPLVAEKRNPFEGRAQHNGAYMALMRYARDTDPEAVKNEVKSRYATLNSELAKDDSEMIYAGAPYSPEQMGMQFEDYSVAPDAEKERRTRYVIYAILILLPAINLSGMMRSRLRQRISEIGVRRAYGAKRSDIILQLIGENFLVTLVGGVIGLLACYLFMTSLASEFFMFIDDSRIQVMEAKMANPEFKMLFTWGSFFVALGTCFLLNLLTATVPAWQASRMVPAEAISNSRK